LAEKILQETSFADKVKVERITKPVDRFSKLDEMLASFKRNTVGAS